MEIILLENILNLGKIGDKVVVANGYGRNFLLRKGKALRFNKANEELVNKKKSELNKKNIELKNEFIKIMNDAGLTVQTGGRIMTICDKVNKSEAIKLLEFLASPEGSKGLAAPTFEHPLKEVNQNPIVKNFGEFTPDEVTVDDLGVNNALAIKLMKDAGWN